MHVPTNTLLACTTDDQWTTGLLTLRTTLRRNTEAGRVKRRNLRQHNAAAHLQTKILRMCNPVEGDLLQ